MARRRLTADEQALWTHVTRSVAPSAKRRVTAADDEPAPKPEPRRKLPIAVAPAAPAAPQVLRQAPAPLGRKARRRLKRGADAIDDRLDLHGLTQAEAHDALLRFLRIAQGRGARIVLVITGKGGASAEGRGVLKRQVPMWLKLAEFRELVVGFEGAAVGHGGEGAIYVRLRRAKE